VVLLGKLYKNASPSCHYDTTPPWSLSKVIIKPEALNLPLKILKICWYVS
jgi:hypothetical protein